MGAFSISDLQHFQMISLYGVTVNLFIFMSIGINFSTFG